MTLHEKIDYIMANIDSNIGGGSSSKDYLDIWTAGWCHGFTSCLINANSNSSHGQGYDQYKYYLTISANWYGWAYGHAYRNDKFNLTNVKQLKMIYNESRTYSSVYKGIGVAKSIITSVPGSTLTSYDSVFDKVYCVNGETSVTNGIMYLDVSDLSGEYYIYVIFGSSNCGEGSFSGRFEVQSIHGLY